MYNYLITELFNLQDKQYREFQSKLIPSVNIDSIIGVRTPELRKISKELFQSDNYNSFLQILPHKYYEENNIHAFIICYIKDYDECIYELNKFLPYVDNWSTCDMMKPKCFTKNLDKLYIQIIKWINSENTYTVRFAIKLLMNFYLDINFKDEYNNIVASVNSEEYYIKMMKSWYFATALAKQYKATIPVLENQVLDVWTHNKTIQKAIESYRISDSQKSYLKKLKIRGSK